MAIRVKSSGYVSKASAHTALSSLLAGCTGLTTLISATQTELGMTVKWHVIVKP
jgi:hypothetical protein